MNHHNELRKKIQDYSYGLSDSDVIGKGYSSVVFRGINERTRQVVAIKVIDIKSFKDRAGRQMLEGEIDALRKLNHVNILKCFDIYSTKNNCYIITEFCTEGDLKNLLKRRQKLTEQQAIPVFRDIYKGFKYLANRGFLHRDLKPANIFIKDNIYKIADFGFAKRDSGIARKQQYNVGTPLYMSPQALKGNIYTIKNDIWSIGVILFEMLHGNTPWECKNEKDLMEKMIRMPVIFNKSLSDDLKDFIRRCLIPEEDKRFTINEMDNHPFIKRIITDAYMDEFQSVPPLLNKISSNAENAEVVEDKPLREERQKAVTKEQKAITGQLFFMRYMYRFLEMLPKGKLQFIVLKQMVSTLETLKGLKENKNPYGLENWDEFLNNDKTKKIIQVISEYAKKYAKAYSEIDEYITQGSKDRRFLTYLDKNFERSESLCLAAVFYSLEDIRKLIKQLREDPTITSLPDDTFLPEQKQKIALRLDFSITYYQLNCLCIDNFSDIDYFARTSKVEVVTEYRPSNLQKMHLKDIEAKAKELEIL